ncbi:transporter [Burkholderia sp. SRS-46]|nr:transporter [Burkholderia sp. SRS-46]
MNVRSMIVVAGVAMVSSLACHAQSAAPDAMAPGAQAAPEASAPASPKAVKKAERAANRAFAKTVRQAIMKSPGIGNAQVTVFAKAKTGEVTLAGLVTDESQGRAAVEAARHVQGVTSVTSKLGLRLEGGQ